MYSAPWPTAKRPVTTANVPRYLNPSAVAESADAECCSPIFVIGRPEYAAHCGAEPVALTCCALQSMLSVMTPANATYAAVRIQNTKFPLTLILFSPAEPNQVVCFSDGEQHWFFDPCDARAFCVGQLQSPCVKTPALLHQAERFCRYANPEESGA